MKEVDNESKAEIASCIKLHLIVNMSENYRFLHTLFMSQQLLTTVKLLIKNKNILKRIRIANTLGFLPYQAISKQYDCQYN